MQASRFELMPQRLIQAQFAMATEAAVARALKGHGFGVSADLASLCLKPFQLLLRIDTRLEEAGEVVAPQRGKQGGSQTHRPLTPRHGTPTGEAIDCAWGFVVIGA